MARSLVVFTILLAVLLFAGGCRSTESVRIVTGVEQRPMYALFTGHAAALNGLVNDKGLVDYSRLKQYKDQLITLLEEFSRLDPSEYRSWPKADRIAFWINTYNLQKLKVVVDNYPVTPSSPILSTYWGPLSIRHIEGKISGYRFVIMGEHFTFAEVDKRFFRDQFDDPRIFLALTSASLSSPPLRNGPYFGNKLNEQLDEQVRKFLSSPLAFRIDRDERIVYLSAIFELSSRGREFVKKFATDKKFKDQPPVTRAALNFITNYISQKDVSFLESGNYTVRFMKHDWTINDSS